MRTAVRWRLSNSRQARSPSANARSVEPTRSVQRIVASTRSGTGNALGMSRKRSISSVTAVPAAAEWSGPSRATSWACGMPGHEALRPLRRGYGRLGRARTRACDKRTRVGTLIAGRTSVTSDSATARRNSAAAPGLAVASVATVIACMNPGLSTADGHCSRRTFRPSHAFPSAHGSVAPSACAPRRSPAAPSVVEDECRGPARGSWPRTARPAGRPHQPRTVPPRPIRPRPVPRERRPSAPRASATCEGDRTLRCHACRRR